MTSLRGGRSSIGHASISSVWSRAADETQRRRFEISDHAGELLTLHEEDDETSITELGMDFAKGWSTESGSKSSSAVETKTKEFGGFSLLTGNLSSSRSFSAEGDAKKKDNFLLRHSPSPFSVPLNPTMLATIMPPPIPSSPVPNRRPVLSDSIPSITTMHHHHHSTIARPIKNQESSSVFVSRRNMQPPPVGRGLRTDDWTAHARIDIPTVPGVNLIGRILGPRGISAKQLEVATGCMLFIRGRGSIKDPEREEEMRNQPGWEHLHDVLHVLVVATALDQVESERRVERALGMLRRLLTSNNDNYKKRQLLQLAVLNGTYRADFGGASLLQAMGLLPLHASLEDPLFDVGVCAAEGVTCDSGAANGPPVAVSVKNSHSTGTASSVNRKPASATISRDVGAASSAKKSFVNAIPSTVIATTALVRHAASASGRPCTTIHRSRASRVVANSTSDEDKHDATSVQTTHQPTSHSKRRRGRRGRRNRTDSAAVANIGQPTKCTTTAVEISPAKPDDKVPEGRNLLL